ncbi:MAG: methanogenesis marker protein Mmp4/MtxX [archaeon]|nr:methanogenesis marker protein Mmp4/MtxX [archaeon]
MLKSENLLGEDLPNVKVGIGCAPDSKYVETSVRALNNPNVIIYRDPQKLADDLANGVIDAAVRGDMSSSKLLPILKKSLGLDRLQRVVILGYRDKAVLVTPVGIDEGWTVEDRVSMAKRSEKLLKGIGCESVRIAVMSGGRNEDIGRNDVVDQTLSDAMEVVKQLNKDGYNAYDAQILLEDAVEEADLIVAPNGITGNLIFRAMHFIGGAPAFGAPVINTDKVFVDTSRVKTDYTDSLILAMKLAGMKG